MKFARRTSGFTLIELLVVISILGILAALSVPALKNLGKSNIAVSASRQLLDDLGRARQLAISQRTTVYMVFVPTNFFNPAWLGYLSAAQAAAATNLVDKQLTGYNFLAYGKVGDQPGQHAWHYLSSWQSLPDGTFLAANKFLLPYNYFNINQWQSDYARPAITNFTRVVAPFPDDTSPTNSLPCVAFDYTGKLVSELTANGQYLDAYIPLAQGTVSYGLDPSSKVPQFTTVSASAITEMPAGNSSDISYNVIHIDALTGRAVLEFHKIP